MSDLIRPLPARSVLLSILLGSHPPELPVRVLVRVGELFGIAEGTARVALSRLAADGDVVSDGGTYALSDRHLSRQRGQDAALRPPTRPWAGRWEVLVGLSSDDSAAAADRRMARLRPGVWVRPDNLNRPLPPLEAGATLWVASVAGGDLPPADSLWDLTGWAATAGALTATLASASEPAARLAVAAAMVRHLRADPLLPAELLPASWPGAELRAVYDGYRAEMGAFIRALTDSS